MTTQSSFEEAYGRAWAAMARREGHMPRLPDNDSPFAINGRRGGRPKGGILPGSIAHRVLGFLRSRQGQWATTREIADGIGADASAVGDNLPKLVRRGHIIRGPKAHNSGTARLWAAK